MFDKEKIRFWIGTAWVLTFFGLWGIFTLLTPQTMMVKEISRLEKNVVAENWPAAAENMRAINDIWNNKKIVIQMNNGSEQVDDFEHMLAQVQTMIRYEDDEVELIGGLMQMAKNITTTFPGP